MRPARRRGTEPAAGAPGDSRRERLAPLPDGERDRALLELVRTHVAAVLGHPPRNRWTPGAPSRRWASTRSPPSNCATCWPAPPARPLPATLVSRPQPHPAHPRRPPQVRARARPADQARSALAELDRIEAALHTPPDQDGSHARVTSTPRSVCCAAGRTSHARSTEPVAPADFRDASDEELFARIDNELGAL
ncbi:acyl carrier protein [Streptomyces tricolor]|nr:acyl carrier protein [Streptomyces tricolor]